MAENYGQMAGNQLQGAQAAGYFNPQGSASLMANVRRNALRNGDNLRRRNAILSRLMGLDPNQARVASVNADTAASGETANALNDAQYNQQAGNQQYFRGLFGSQLGNENQRGLMQFQHDLNAPTIGGTLGSIAGQGLGAWAGGGFSGLGSLFHQQKQQYGPFASGYGYQR